MELEVNVLMFVRSLREANFAMYLDALTEFVSWFYTRSYELCPLDLRDMAELTEMHPDFYQEFKNGHFTAQKTKRIISAIPFDQAHEQSNACVKGDGDAVGLKIQVPCVGG